MPGGGFRVCASAATLGAGVSLGAAALSLTEGGTATYTVVLDTAPAASCTVRVQAESNNADISVDTGDAPLAKTLSFTLSTWSAPQTVTVPGPHDADGANDAAVIHHRIPADSACYANGYYTQSEGTNTSPLAIASVPALVDDDESNDANTVSITSTPANGTHYAAGDVITMRLSGFAPISSGAIHLAQMKLTVGGAGRAAPPATSTG